MPNLVATGLAAPLQQPCHTPRGNTTSTCNALEFIAATANTELSALAQTRGMPLECSWHSPLPSQDTVSFLLHLAGSKLSQKGRPVPFSPFPPTPGQHILKGTAREVAEASVSVGQATLSMSQEGETPADHQAALTGFSPPRRYREQL